MIDALLRRPRLPGDVVPDGVRALGVGSLLAAAAWFGPVETALFALVLLGLLILRALAVPAVLDAAGGAVLLVAAWSSVADLYARISWWDIAVHLAATGALAAMGYLLLARLKAVPDPQGPAAGVRAARTVTVLLVICVGLALSVVWEFGEWWGHTFIDSRINVGYDDTLGDLLAGGIGSVAAGLALTTRRRSASPAAAASREARRQHSHRP